LKNFIAIHAARDGGGVALGLIESSENSRRVNDGLSKANGKFCEYSDNIVVDDRSVSSSQFTDLDICSLWRYLLFFL